MLAAIASASWASRSVGAGSPSAIATLARVVSASITHLMVNTAAAHRDPAVYDDPDRLDITREGPATMLTFGGGIHYCLGAQLARAELAEALTVITRRMPNPRTSGPVPWKPIMGITGPTTLPIEFDAGH
jgi:cytochrome P450